MRMNVLDATDPSAFTQALDILARGGVIAHATETCYGFACDLNNRNAVKALFDLKQRPVHQPVSALFASVEQAKDYVVWNSSADTLAATYLPGPLTLILPYRSDAYEALFLSMEHTTSVGVRISSHPLAMQLVTAFGKPLATTSANLHGFSEPYDVDALLGQFTGQLLQPDLILNSGELPHVPPSTIVDATGTELKVIRQGSIRID